MSDYEAHRGRLIPQFRLEDESDLNYLNRVAEQEVTEEEYNDYDGIEETLSELDLYEDFFYVNGTLYKNVDHVEASPYHAQNLEGNDINGYSYFMMFYNGGTCLSEMIENGLNKLNKNDK